MISFAKYVAAGNDFIVCEQLPSNIALLCDRREGIGADGLIWLENDRVHFFNQDGSRASCCGNGLRVAAMHTKRVLLHTDLGSHQVEFLDQECRVSYPDPRNFHQVDLVEDPYAIHHGPQTINRNYVKVISTEHVLIKTIERGVGETPSCGSGAISTLLTLLEQNIISHKIKAQFTSGQQLWVEHVMGKTWLQGAVRPVFHGCHP